MQIVLPHTLSAVLEETRAHAYAMAMQVVVNPSSQWVALTVTRRAARNITHFYPRVASCGGKKNMHFTMLRRIVNDLSRRSLSESL